MSPEAAEKFLEGIDVHVDHHLGDGNIMCHCPFHRDEKPSFSFHGDMEVFNCFSCGESGHLLELVELLECEDVVPDIAIDMMQAPVAKRFHDLRDRSRTVFAELNEAVIEADIPLREKDWCWDRIDQMLAFLPPYEGATLASLKGYEKRMDKELLELPRFLRAARRSEEKADQLVRDAIDSRAWKVWDEDEQSTRSKRDGSRRRSKKDAA